MRIYINAHTELLHELFDAISLHIQAIPFI